jgi:hypothetical protein
MIEYFVSYVIESGAADLFHVETIVVSSITIVTFIPTFRTVHLHRGL